MDALERLELPVSKPEYSPKAVSEDYYYRIPAATIYKSYPVYAPGRVPLGYIEKLKRLPPGARMGDNKNAFLGGYRLWDEQYWAK